MKISEPSRGVGFVKLRVLPRFLDDEAWLPLPKTFWNSLALMVDLRCRRTLDFRF